MIVGMLINDQECCRRDHVTIEMSPPWVKTLIATILITLSVAATAATFSNVFIQNVAILAQVVVSSR
jgi:hypothetical protein